MLDQKKKIVDNVRDPVDGENGWFDDRRRILWRPTDEAPPLWLLQWGDKSATAMVGDDSS